MATSNKTVRHVIKPNPALAILEQGHVDQQKAVREAERDCKRIGSRAADRLAVAADRHRAVIVRINEEKEARRLLLERETAKTEAIAAQVSLAARDRVANAQIRIGEAGSEKQDHERRKQEAVEHAAKQRTLAGQHLEQSEKNYEAVVNEANQAIERSALATRAELTKQQERREELRLKCQDDIVATQLESEAIAASAKARGRSELLRSEVTQHRAGLAVALAHESAQATRTQAMEKVAKTLDAAHAGAAAIARESHEARKNCDAELVTQMRDSWVALEAAHDRCLQVKAELAQEASAYKQRMQDIGHEADASARGAERRVQTLEQERLALFGDGQRRVGEAEAALKSKRETSESELEAVHRRLRSVEDETRDRVQQILASWLDGSRATEATIRGLEHEGQAAINSMQSDVNRMIEQFSKQHCETQKNSANMVAMMKRRANKVVDSTQPSVDSARHSDDQAAQVARMALQELKLVPDEIRMDAEKEIQTFEEKAEAEVDRLLKEGEAAAEAGKNASKRAREQEEWLRAETAAAWARIRHACYQLRLFNLHDFAKGISEGAFDLLPDEVLAHG